MVILVEDNPDVSFTIQTTLEINNFTVITALNGVEAIRKLTEAENPPDLIISDIMMPEMNGYEFFKKVSGNPNWSEIPFLFLTAKATPEDIRFGKMLGIDDYLTKPVHEKDLLASITGKLARKNKINSIKEKFEEKIFSSLEKLLHPSLSEKERDSVYLLFLDWDNEEGPKLRDYYPKTGDFSLLIEKIALQLYYTATSIFGHEGVSEAEGVLLPIKNVNKYSYAFFDSLKDSERKRGKLPFMLAILAPEINYFETLRIKETLKEISDKMNKSIAWDIEEYQKKISELLST
ncbi:MAG: response regulator [Candidatus Hodarchaeales archaeon]